MRTLQWILAIITSLLLTYFLFSDQKLAAGLVAGTGAGGILVLSMFRLTRIKPKDQEVK